MTSPVRAPRPTPRRTAPHEAPAERARHLRVVPPPGRPQRRRRRSGAAVVAATALVFGSLLTSAMLHGLLVSGQAEINRLDAELADSRTTLAQEKLTLANLQAPARIAAEAQLLGMQPADGQHWLSPGSDDAPVVTGHAPPPVDEPVDESDPVDPGIDDVPVDGSELASATGGATR